MLNEFWFHACSGGKNYDEINLCGVQLQGKKFELLVGKVVKNI